MIKKLKNANHFINQKLHSALILRMQQRRVNMRGIQQCLHNGRTNVESESEVENVKVPSSIKWRKLIVELFNRLGASNPAYEPKLKLFVSKEASLEILSDSAESPLNLHLPSKRIFNCFRRAQ